MQHSQEIEKAAAVQEKKELFQQRRHQQTKIARLASQMEVVAMYEDWNTHDKKLLGYIKTETRPHIYYMPVTHNSKTHKLLSQSNQGTKQKIKKRQEELEVIIKRRQHQEEGNIEEGTSFVGNEIKKEGGKREGGRGGSESGEASE